VGHASGEQALSAPRAAVEQWTRVVYAAGQIGKAVPSTSYLSRGQAYEMLGDLEQAQAGYERALHTAHQEQDCRLEWQSLQNLGFLWTSRDYQRARDYFQQAVEVATQLGDVRLEGHSLNRLGNWLLNTGQAAEAQVTHEKALALFEAQNDQSGMAETLDLLGIVYHLKGDSISAFHMYGRAIELLRAVGNRIVLCSCLTMHAAIACPWGGDTSCTVNLSLAECERDLVEALQLAHELDWAAGVASVESFLGGALAAFGQLGAGLAHLRQGLHLAQEMNHQQWVAGAHYSLASIYLSLLAPEQAAYATLPKEKPVSLRRATANAYDGLSEREREVAALIGQGKSNSEIASLLVVSKRTVETYVSRVLSKLGLTSRSQIALWTRDKRLVTRES
jgi:DNA-binding CsgD family transcriptional regulator/tetratricopeptide (TPR) repeat protein